MLDSSFVTFVGLILSAAIVSIALYRGGRSKSWLQRVGLIGLGIYLPFVVGITLGGGIPADAGEGINGWRAWANVVPFGTLGPQLASGLESAIHQVVGNLLMLGPLGFLLPVVWDRFRRFGSTVAVGFGVALAIEISQSTLSLVRGSPYRAFDVDDLILNTVGVILGWLAWRLTLGLLAVKNQENNRNRAMTRR